MTTDWRKYAIEELGYNEDDDGNPRTAPFTNKEEAVIMEYIDYAQRDYYGHGGADRGLVRTVVDLRTRLAASEGRVVALQGAAERLIVEIAKEHGERHDFWEAVNDLGCVLDAALTTPPALAPAPDASTPMPERDTLGRMVRSAWIAWANEQPAPKPSWLVPYDDLSEPDREVDRRIGERLYRAGVNAATDGPRAATEQDDGCPFPETCASDERCRGQCW